jgi:DnaJ-class molecular chaperone
MSDDPRVAECGFILAVGEACPKMQPPSVKVTCPTCSGSGDYHRHVELYRDGTEKVSLFSSHHPAADKSTGVDGFHAGVILSTELCPTCHGEGSVTA